MLSNLGFTLDISKFILQQNDLVILGQLDRRSIDKVAFHEITTVTCGSRDKMIVVFPAPRKPVRRVRVARSDRYPNEPVNTVIGIDSTVIVR